jgi:hypothetical protein
MARGTYTPEPWKKRQPRPEAAAAPVAAPGVFRQPVLGEDTSGSGDRALAAEAVCVLLERYLVSRASDLAAWDAMKDAVRVWQAHVAAGTPLHPQAPE